MKFKLKTYTRTVIEAEYLGNTMVMDCYGKKKPTKAQVLTMCREEIREFRYNKPTQEYDIFVKGDRDCYISRHTSIKVSESLHKQIDSLLSEKFMYHPGQEERKELQRIKVLELFESAPKIEEVSQTA